MGNEIKHDPITGEPMLGTEDLSQVQLDPVTEFKLVHEEFEQKRQFNVMQQGMGIPQQNVQFPAGYGVRPNVLPPAGPRFRQANAAWAASNAQYLAQKKFNDNKSKGALWLCIISLSLWLILRFMIVALIIDDSSLDPFLYFISDNFNPLQSIVAVLLMFFALVFVPYILLVITRVKYKYNKFAKVLQWVYIGEIALFVILIRLVILLVA